MRDVQSDCREWLLFGADSGDFLKRLSVQSAVMSAIFFDPSLSNAKLTPMVPMVTSALADGDKLSGVTCCGCLLMRNIESEFSTEACRYEADNHLG